MTDDTIFADGVRANLKAMKAVIKDANCIIGKATRLAESDNPYGAILAVLKAEELLVYATAHFKAITGLNNYRQFRRSKWHPIPLQAAKTGAKHSTKGGS